MELFSVVKNTSGKAVRDAPTQAANRAQVIGPSAIRRADIAGHRNIPAHALWAQGEASEPGAAIGSADAITTGARNHPYAWNVFSWQRRRECGGKLS